MHIWSGSICHHRKRKQEVLRMSGNIWMFSDQIDDVDLEFARDMSVCGCND